MRGGEIVVDGRKVVLNPHLAMQMGIQTIYQEHTIFENLNIVENIFTGQKSFDGACCKRAK